MKEKFKILVLLLILGLQVHGQSQRITGTVTDENGDVLPGAAVILVGTTQGSITDLNGKYIVNASTGNQLKFSFIGYQDQIITVGDELVINVRMLTATEVLDEVVVIGYGTQKKATLVGAITQTTSDELKTQGNIVNLTEALAGSMPGVFIINSSGIPGGSGTDGYSKAAEILVRGKNTWNNASPLILVDGIERDMNDIDINEVETITTLKDASATAVFGMKGGNGVILITTKRGLVGKPKLSFEANKTFETISKYPLSIDAHSALIAMNYAIINEVDLIPNSWKYYTNDKILKHYEDQDLPYAFPSYNWQELILKDFGTSERFNMNITGGTKFVKYFGSLSYLHEGDVMNTKDIGRGYNPEFSYDRFNARTNLDFAISNSTTLKTSLSGVYGRQQRSNASVHSIYTTIYGHWPNSPVIQYEDGTFGFSKEEALNNHNEVQALNTEGIRIENRMEILSDFALDQKLDFITRGLSLRGKLAFDNFFQTSGPNINDGGVNAKWIDPEFYLNGGTYNYETKRYEMNGVPVDMVKEGYAEYMNNTSGTTNFGWVPSELGYGTEGYASNGDDIKATKYTLYYEASLNYARDFGRHGVSALAVFNRQKSESGSGWPKKREDWVGRITYDYDSKYFAEVNGAYNGSEAFGPDYKFDFFPSVAVGWNIANESFIKQIAPFLQVLKIKYSNGLVGNDGVGAGGWPYLTIWSKGNPLGGDNSRGFGVNPIPTYQKYQEGTPGNPELRWEKARKQNLGTEIELFNGLISGSVDLFKEHRYDMLVAANSRTIPHIFGQTPPAANIGEVKSKGMEMEASLSKRFKNGFNFGLGGSWTYARNEVINKEDAELKPFYQKAAGYPIGQTRATIQTGLMNSWDDVYNGVVSVGSNIDRLPGDFIMMDYNANGRIDPDDGAPYGYPVYPFSTYTTNIRIGYKGWSLFALFYGIHNVTREVGFPIFQFNGPVIHQHYIDATWTPEYGNENPTYPHINLARGAGAGTFNLYDGALLRLKSIELSYTLPKNWSNKVGSSDIRFYANGNNLFVWTKMPADGEGRNRSDDQGRNYPLKRSATIGANIKF